LADQQGENLAEIGDEDDEVGKSWRGQEVDESLVEIRL
jgi:hypothetical protein